MSARAPLPRAADRRGWLATSPHPVDGGVRGRARSDDRLARSRPGDAVESHPFSWTRPGKAPDAEAHFSRGDTTGLVWSLLRAAERRGVWRRAQSARLSAKHLSRIRREVRLARLAAALATHRGIGDRQFTPHVGARVGLLRTGRLAAGSRGGGDSAGR